MERGVSEKIRVLLVEDSDADAELVDHSLGANPQLFELAVVDRLTAAEEHLRAHDVDVVLLDLGLPDSEGIDTFLSLRGVLGDAAVVILSVTDDEDVAVQAVSEGAQDYVSKEQVRPRTLPRIVRYALERQHAKTELRELNERLQSFVGQAVHDLRTPLATVEGLAEVLSNPEDLARDDLSQLVNGVRRQTRVLSRMVGDLLELTRSERDVVIESLDVQQVIDDVLASAPAPAGTEVTVRVDGRPRARGESTVLGRVLQNLLVNAYDYGGDHVTIEACEEGGRVVIEVRDDGEGVPGDVEARLFDEFARGSNARSSDGTGLGLAIVRRLTEAMGGDVVHRRDAGHTVFVVTLEPATE